MKIFFIPAIIFCCTIVGCSKGFDDTGFVPVHLTSIEAVNVDNAGEFPFVATDSIKKEAYMIGVRWATDDADPGGDQYIMDPVRRGRSYHTLGDSYQKRIYCNTAFNDRNPAGSNVSQYFKTAKYLPDGVDEGFVLLVAPDPGKHSFRVVYYNNDEEVFEYNTLIITLH